MFNDGEAFIDLARLRLGTLYNHGVKSDKLIVWYRPAGKNPFRTVSYTIPDPKAWLQVGRMTEIDTPGTFSRAFIVLKDESGNSPFLEGVLGNRLPAMLQKMAELRRQQEIASAARKSLESKMKLGEKGMITDWTQKQRMFGRIPSDEEKARQEQLTGPTNEEF